MTLNIHSHDDDVGKLILQPLLPKPPHIAKPGDRLCDVCEALNFTPRRFVILPNEKGNWIKLSDPDIRLGHVKDIRAKSYCPLCRLVLSSLGGNSVPDVQRGHRVKVRMSWFSNGLTREAYPVERYTPLVRILQLDVYTGKGKNRSPVHVSTSPFPRITMLANDSPTPFKTGLIRLIDDQIDFSMILNAFKLCRTWHGIACNKSEKFHAEFEDPAADIPHFRLIDTEYSCVVHPPKGSTYATLSYVWGRINPERILRLLKVNVEQLSRPGSLLLPTHYNKIPVTIRDAMEVVRRLGLRYLWVDSLCIVQDDEGPGGSKMSAISKMDLVYGGAYVTIMAATGIDANAGLPGVWPGTRGLASTQIVEELYPGLRLAYMETARESSDPVYFDRAWTFQEQQLASRSLIFSSDQVISKCQKNTDGWREDVVFEDAMQRIQAERNESNPNELEDNKGRRDRAEYKNFRPNEEEADDDDESSTDEDSDDGGNGEDNSDIKDFTDVLIYYSGRSLTYNTDIYHAFAGMTRYFKEELHANLCHGIPDAYFEWFLLWTPSSKVPARRVIAPSWSWSGWIGGIELEIVTHTYYHKLSKIRKSIQRHTWIVWYHRKGHDYEEYQLIATPQEKLLRPSSLITGCKSSGRRAKDLFPLDCSQTAPTRRRLGGAPRYVEDSNNPSPGSGFLQFWTVSAMFRLDKLSGKKAKKRVGRSGHVRVGIYGRSGRELGIIFLDPKWAEANVPKTHEFILLCDGRGLPSHDDDDEDDDDDDAWKYMIMLLEWHGDWAERVALGKIGKGDLSQAMGQGPVWKEIILG